MALAEIQGEAPRQARSLEFAQQTRQSLDDVIQAMVGVNSEGRQISRRRRQRNQQSSRDMGRGVGRTYFLNLGALAWLREESGATDACMSRRKPGQPNPCGGPARL